MWQALQGRKSYIVAAVTVLYAVVGWWYGSLNDQAAMAMIFGGAGLGALRHGVSKGGTGAALFLAVAVSLALSACNGQNPAQVATTVTTDITAGIAAACTDAANTAKQFPTSPVAVYAQAACPGGLAAASLVQNSATLQWLGQIIGQMQAAASAKT